MGNTISIKKTAEPVLTHTSLPENPLHALRKALQEFRAYDISISERAYQAWEILDNIIEKSGVKITSEDLKLLNNFRHNCMTVMTKKDFWKGIIKDPMLDADENDISDTLVAINRTLQSSRKNAAYKERLHACYHITQSYDKLRPLLQRICKSSSSNTSIMKLGSIELDASQLSSLLAFSFQILPRHVTFMDDWHKKIVKGKLDNCLPAVESLLRKYKRGSALLNQTLKDIDIAKSTLNADAAYIDRVYASAVTKTLEDTPFKKIQDEVDSIHSPFSTPKRSAKVNTMLTPQRNDNFDFTTEVNYMLEGSEPAHSDRDSADSRTLRFEVGTVEVARYLFDESEECMVTPYLKRLLSARNHTTPIKQPDFSGFTPIKNKPITEDIDAKMSVAQQAIENLRAALASSHHPVSFGGGSMHKKEDGSTISIPHYEKRMRLMLASFERQKLNNYQGLAADILNTAIEAEVDVPFFSRRSAATSNFYGSMFGILGVNVQASLDNIEQFIREKDQAHWGTRVHERPATVNKILSVIQNSKKSDVEKLKAVIQIARIAAEKKDDIINLRSQTTEIFYKYFTYSFIKLDENLIKPALGNDRSKIIDEIESSSIRP